MAVNLPEAILGTNLALKQIEDVLTKHDLPWSSLTYDADKEGYIVNLDKRQLENAPTLDPDEDFQWTPDYGRRVDKYYGAPTYW